MRSKVHTLLTTRSPRITQAKAWNNKLPARSTQSVTTGSKVDALRFQEETLLRESLVVLYVLHNHKMERRDLAYLIDPKGEEDDQHVGPWMVVLKGGKKGWLLREIFSIRARASAM